MAAAGPALAAAGYVHDLKGSATVRAGSAEARPLRIGDLVDTGQTIATGDNSSAVIKFEDGQIMALSQRSSFAVQDYAYDKKNIGASRAVFNVIQGGLRFITGVIGATNRNAVSLRAGTSTIGIRGTDVVIYVDAVTQAVTAAVNSGAIALSSQQGLLVAVVGQVATILPGATPQLVGLLANVAASLPAVVSASVANLNSATSIPVSTPVNLEISARAVALAALAASQPNNADLQQQAAAALQEAVQAAIEALQTAIAAGGNTSVIQADTPAGTSGGTPATGAGGSASPN